MGCPWDAHGLPPVILTPLQAWPPSWEPVQFQALVPMLACVRFLHAVLTGPHNTDGPKLLTRVFQGFPCMICWKHSLTFLHPLTYFSMNGKHLFTLSYVQSYFQLHIKTGEAFVKVFITPSPGGQGCACGSIAGILQVQWDKGGGTRPEEMSWWWQSPPQQVSCACSAPETEGHRLSPCPGKPWRELFPDRFCIDQKRGSLHLPNVRTPIIGLRVTSHPWVSYWGGAYFPNDCHS